MVLKYFKKFHEIFKYFKVKYFIVHLYSQVTGIASQINYTAQVTTTSCAYCKDGTTSVLVCRADILLVRMAKYDE